MTFCRLLFSRYNRSSDQLFSRHSYSRYSCYTWLFPRRGCSLYIAVPQTWLFSIYSCSPDVAVLYIQLFSRRGCQLFSSGCSPDMAALHIAVFQTWLFSRHSCSPDIVLLFGAAKRTGHFGPIRHPIILQIWLFSKRDQDPPTTVS